MEYIKNVNNFIKLLKTTANNVIEGKYTVNVPSIYTYYVINHTTNEVWLSINIYHELRSLYNLFNKGKWKRTDDIEEGFIHNNSIRLINKKYRILNEFDYFYDDLLSYYERDTKRYGIILG